MTACAGGRRWCKEILCDGMITHFVCKLHCPLVGAHQALHLPLCGWQLVEQPASAASLPSPEALQVALVPAPASTVIPC